MRSKNCNSLHSTTDIANPGAVYVYSYVDNKWDELHCSRVASGITTIVVNRAEIITCTEE